MIDEAHIVVDWGAAFRVGLSVSRGLAKYAINDKSISANNTLISTFEDKCVEILKNFFEVSGRWIEIRCDALRHEPRYSVVRLRNNSEKQKCLN